MKNRVWNHFTQDPTKKTKAAFGLCSHSPSLEVWPVDNIPWAGLVTPEQIASSWLCGHIISTNRKSLFQPVWTTSGCAQGGHRGAVLGVQQSSPRENHGASVWDQQLTAERGKDRSWSWALKWLWKDADWQDDRNSVHCSKLLTREDSRKNTELTHNLYLTTSLSPY